VGLAGGQEAISFSVFQEFKLFQEFGLFQEFCEIYENSEGSMISAQSLNVDQLSGGEKKIVYILFCIFIIIVVITIVSIISSISVSISFVALLNCPFLKPGVFPFVHFSSPSCCGGRGGVSERLSGA